MTLARWWLLLAGILLVASPVAAGGPGGSWETYWRAAARAREHGHYAEAEKMLSAALAAAEAITPPDTRVVESLVGLAGVHLSLHRYAEAEPLVRRAAGIAAQVSGPRHPAVARILADHAVVLRALGRGTEAAAVEARLRAILEDPSVQRPSTIWERPGFAEADLDADEVACAREARYGTSGHGSLIDPVGFTRCIERHGWRPKSRLAGSDGQPE